MPDDTTLAGDIGRAKVRSICKALGCNELQRCYGVPHAGAVDLCDECHKKILSELAGAV